VTETDIEKLLKALHQQGAWEGLINAITSGRSRQGFEIDSRARSASGDAQDRKEKLAAKKFLFI